MVIDSNRILTDLLVNFRRIVHRGLVTYSGELWYREGLPSDVFRRLVVRKENETPLDRFSGDYEELMTYANFRDLADIIVGNEVLQDRLTILEPRDGASLLDRLHELEELRRKVAGGEPASDEEVGRLQRYFDEFRSAIKRRRSSPTAEQDPPRRSSQAAPSRPPSAAEEETLDALFGDEEETPPPRPKKRPGRLVVKVSSGGAKKAADRPAKNESRQPKAEPRPVSDEVGSIETPVTEVSTRPAPGAEEDEGPVEAAEAIERFLSEDDSAAVLKALHVEVTEIADGMLRRDPKHGHIVWERVTKRGWFEAHRDEFELQPLEGFYQLADDFHEAFASGAKSSELKAMLAEAGFSKMLLELREMFLAARARV